MEIISILCCPECYATGLKLAEDSKEGLCSNFVCGWQLWVHDWLYFTPKENKKFSLNTLLVFGLRLIGRGFTAGSSGNMEAVGAFRIFERSLIKRDMQYNEYYCDGDSKGFLQVKDIYGENSVTKLECLGHIQKKKLLWDCHPQQCWMPQKMKSAVIAAFYHCFSSNQNPMHVQCPTGKDSWCKYKQALRDVTRHLSSGYKSHLAGSHRSCWQRSISTSKLLSVGMMCFGDMSQLNNSNYR
ncbi:uncharacterized protein TNCV_3853501 [Trichonephila clavipes]|nr:uncharacterized protein TNCV_3853501 [Trichonephila clavipes]